MATILPQIRIVLMETSHSGNIGAVARAMKTMGLANLALVAPKNFPSDEAYALSSHATDVLDQAQIYPDLASAIADCHLVIGTSARARKVPWPLYHPRQIADQVMTELNNNTGAQQIAIVFGRERTGLTNEELQSCHSHVHIPSNEDYNSLNLAQAVQVIAYELRMACLANTTDEILDSNNTTTMLAKSAEVEGFYQHLEQVLRQIQFLDDAQEGMLMRKLRRLFQRSRLETAEIHILRGILSKVQRCLPD